MDESEARYLIDQFNKFASWRLTRWNYAYPVLTLLVAAMAIFYSLTGTYQAVILLEHPYSEITRAAAWTFFFVMAGVSAFTVGGYGKEVRFLQERLAILEDYRFKHKALPDSVPFTVMVERCPEQLEKLLKESEQEIARHGRL